MVMGSSAILCKPTLPLSSKPASPNIEFGPEYFEGLTVKAGDNIRLKVTITGRPVPKVVWFRDGVEITKKMMDIINVAGSSTLFVRDADRTHRGLYTVEATNGSGTKKENILVQVQGMHSFVLLCFYLHLFTHVFTF